MTRRTAAVVFLGLAAVALAAGVGATVGAAATTPAPKPAPPVRAGFVSLTEFMTKSKKWQAKATAMNQMRADAGRQLGVLKAAFEARKAAADAAKPDDKIELVKHQLVAQRAFEDAERAAREDVEKRSHQHLKDLHAEFAATVERIAKARQIDIVFGGPARLDRMDRLPPNTSEVQFMDLYFRPPAMAPLYMTDAIDLTADVLEEFNKTAD
jgi:Skp family chaperone for outer membrane proteins